MLESIWSVIKKIYQTRIYIIAFILLIVSLTLSFTLCKTIYNTIFYERDENNNIGEVKSGIVYTIISWIVTIFVISIRNDQFIISADFFNDVLR